MNWSFPLIFLALAFFLEKLLAYLFNFPVFIFPALIFAFALHCQTVKKDWPAIIIAVFVYDIFSGFPFGIFTAGVLIALILTALFRRYLVVAVGGQSVVIELILASFLVFLLSALLLFFTGVGNWRSILPPIIIQTLATLAVFHYLIFLYRRHSAKLR